MSRQSCRLYVAKKIMFLIAGNDDDDDDDDVAAENAAIQIPDAVFGSHGFPTPTVAANGELIVPLIPPLMWVGCKKKWWNRCDRPVNVDRQ